MELIVSRIPGRKKVALCLRQGSMHEVLAWFISEEKVEEFLAFMRKGPTITT